MPEACFQHDGDQRARLGRGRLHNLQVAVKTVNHLIIAHEVTNSGSDRAQLANMGKQAKAVFGVDKLKVVADRGYYNIPEILACERAGITVTLPKPMTSGSRAEGRLGKRDFVYLADHDAYRCPMGQWLTYRFTREEDGKRLRHDWTNECAGCPLKK